jgi:hypothetical protein
VDKLIGGVTSFVLLSYKFPEWIAKVSGFIFRRINSELRLLVQQC